MSTAVNCAVLTAKALNLRGLYRFVNSVNNKYIKLIIMLYMCIHIYTYPHKTRIHAHTRASVATVATVAKEEKCTNQLLRKK